MNLVQFVNRIRDSLREQPIRLRDIRAKVAEIEAFAGPDRLRRTVVGEIFNTVDLYYPLPEMIALYKHQKEVYREHIRKGELDDTNERYVLIGDVYGLVDWWLQPECRYPYGDVRLLRPIIGEFLVASAEWERSPYPEYSAALGEWYEALAPGGALYPSDEHLDYVRRYEAFAEDIVWDSRGREYITIVNFPAPPNALPPTMWWCTQHAVDSLPSGSHSIVHQTTGR